MHKMSDSEIIVPTTMTKLTEKFEALKGAMDTTDIGRAHEKLNEISRHFNAISNKIKAIINERTPIIRFSDAVASLKRSSCRTRK